MSDQAKNVVSIISSDINPEPGDLLHGHIHQVGGAQPATQKDIELFMNCLSVAVNACDTAAARKLSQSCAEEAEAEKNAH